MNEEAMNLLNKIYSCLLTMQEDIRNLNERVSALETRMDRLEERMDRLEQRMDKLEQRMDKLEECVDKLEERMDKFEIHIKKYIDDSIETLKVVIEYEMDHLELKVVRPSNFYVAESSGKYIVTQE